MFKKNAQSQSLDSHNLRSLLCPTLPSRAGEKTVLPEAEAHHAFGVLRLQDGARVRVMDGKGHRIVAILCKEKNKSGSKSGSIEFVEKLEDAPPPPRVDLEVAILKGEAMEWVVEKAVELGVRRLVPLITDHGVVKVRGQDDRDHLQRRWQGIADQALKQCGRAFRMEIALPLRLTALEWGKREGSSSYVPHDGAGNDGSLTSYRLWCDEKANLSLGDPLLVSWLLRRFPLKETDLRMLIGPEGGWSAQEREFLTHQGLQMQQLPWVRVSLGPHILRAETAAISAVSLATAFLRAL